MYKNLFLKFYLLFCLGVKLGEEHRVRVFENRGLRRISGHKGKEVT
jgi:hypothetical protein